MIQVSKKTGTLFSLGYIETHEMTISINPFQQLWFSDDVQTENSFVTLFSEEVLQTAINPVFQGTNVVLMGTQGCGKTMILNLLRPELRIAYYKENKEFPVSRELRDFISAGINLSRSRITDLVQVTLYQGEDVDSRELPLYFGDFFNYLVVNDLLKSIESIMKYPQVFDGVIDVLKIQDFVSIVVKNECWFGYLDNVVSFDQLRIRVSERIAFYRKWVNGNINETSPPLSIKQSKTNIGEPIAQVAEALRAAKVARDTIPVLIRIDQIEELHRAKTGRQQKLLLDFRKMINRLFASRDARVHYRAGTRRYGWNNPDYMAVWGSEAQLENRRDYNLIDMDTELFSRGEANNSIFESFALDAFEKRVSYYFSDPKMKLSRQFAKSVFGGSPTAAERISQLTPKENNTQIDRVLGLEAKPYKTGWSEDWKKFLRSLYAQGHEGMLDATLAAAWGLQTGGGGSKKQHRELLPPDDQPWKSRKWWRKERLDHAVLQLMTRSQQRFMWWGFKDIMSLSGGNITVFFHICHRIWDGFLKQQDSVPDEKKIDIFSGESIPHLIQDSGILFASNEWFNKLPEEPGGNSRKSFVEGLGMKLNNLMIQDYRMSYPGGNGISIKLSEFESNQSEVRDIDRFISDAVGYGALFETEHSSKNKSSGRRRKFYLNPILCPRFQLPESRTKEPYYWSINDLIELADLVKITLPAKRKKVEDSGGTLPLFPNLGDSEL